MAKLDEIVAGLEAGGSVVDRGEFTLDSERALDKVERFQLRDPAEAPLRFVEIANLLGGSLRALSTPLGLRYYLHRIYFARSELESLFVRVFSPGDTARTRALRELAVGVLATSRRSRTPVRMTSCDRDGPYELTYEGTGGAKANPLEEDWAPTRIDMTLYWISLQAHFRLEEEKELQQLGELARWSTADVYVDDVGVAFNLPQRLAARRFFETDAGRTLIGLRSALARPGLPPAELRYEDIRHHATLHLLSNGVHLERTAISKFPDELTIVLDMRAADKDVSHRRVARNAAFEAQLERVRDHLHEYAKWLRSSTPADSKYGVGRRVQIADEIDACTDIELQ